MTTHEKALRAAARAWLDPAGPSPDPLEDAIAAYNRTLLPGDAVGLVEPLSMSMFISPNDMITRLLSDRAQAASLIQSQAAESEHWRTEYLNAASDAQKFAARIAELEAGLEPFAKVADELTQSKYGPAWGFNNAILEHEDFRHARSLLNGERKG